MSPRLSSTFVCFVLAVVGLFVRTATAQSVDSGTEPAIILNAAPQDREVFLTWTALPQAGYTLRWRKLGSRTWNTEPEISRRYAVVDSLDNLSTYQFQLIVATDAGRYQSLIVSETPRVRDDCYYGAGVFCTQGALLAALPRYGLLPSALRCGDELVSLESTLPNCRFTEAGVTLGLNRSYGSTFTPNDARPDAESVSRVVRRIVWGTEDFETVKREYANRATEVAVPYGGNVTEDANVKSFLVRVVPGMFSRLSWYSRPDHVAGRYAIYHEGHGEAGISSAAGLLNWLLDNGWQVLSLDMPLEGLNEADREFPMYDHDGFAQYDRGDFSALRFFFIPLVSAMDLIEQDAKSIGKPTVMLIGRSGGGWSAYTYASMDRRVDVAVNIAGGAPLSTMLDSTAFNRVTPHYENEVDYLLDQASQTDIMLAGGRRAAFFFYSQNDPCCYRFSPENAWIKYLRQLSEGDVGKRYQVFLDDAPQHGLSNRGLEALGAFLNDMRLGPTVRSRPSAPPRDND